MLNKSFITLNDLILSQPFSTLLALLLLFSLIDIGSKIPKIIFKDKINIIDRFLGYFLVVIFICVFTNLLVTINLLSFFVIRMMAFMLIFMFFINIVNKSSFLHEINYSKINYANFISIKDKIPFVYLTLITFFLFLISMGPPTDHDSLDYHLGVPIDWIRNGGSYFRPDWLHARLIGIGESINIFGLILGTDILGQLIQFSGLFILCLAFLKLVEDKKMKLIIALLVLSPPVNIFFISSQKPMIFPVACILLGFISFIKNNNKNHIRYFISLICIFFAISSKYTFLISGSIILIFLLILSFKRKHLKVTLLSALLIFIFISLPIYSRNYLFYADPFSPFLEQYKSLPDTTLLLWRENIREQFSGYSFLKNLFMFPFNLVFPKSLGEFTTVIGIGVFSILFFRLKKDGFTNSLFLTGILITIGLILTGNLLFPRFYIEPYLLIVGSLTSLNWSLNINYLKKILLIQCFFTLLVLLYGVFSLFPGALTSKNRNNIMESKAEGYSLSKWLDLYTPENSKLLVETRSNALIPREFYTWDYFFINDYSKNDAIKIINKEQITSVALKIPLNKDWLWIKECYDKNNIIGSFFFGARNPYNIGNEYKMQLFILDKTLPGCFLD